MTSSRQNSCEREKTSRSRTRRNFQPPVVRRGRDAINPQAFAKLRPGRRLTSRTWNGFRLFEEPTNTVNFGYAHQFMPWDVWEVVAVEPRFR